MKLRKRVTKIALVLVFVFGVGAFHAPSLAAETGGSRARVSCAKVQAAVQFLDSLKADAAELLAKGTITQDQYNAIIAQLDEFIARIESFYPQCFS